MEKLGGRKVFSTISAPKKAVRKVNPVAKAKRLKGYRKMLAGKEYKVARAEAFERAGNRCELWLSATVTATNGGGNPLSLTDGGYVPTTYVERCPQIFALHAHHKRYPKGRKLTAADLTICCRISRGCSNCESPFVAVPYIGEGEMRLLICGDREWTDREVISEFLRLRFLGAPLLQVNAAGNLQQTSGTPVTIVHGAARGADSLAGDAARALGFNVEEYPADWRKYGKKAGPIRNLQMLDTNPDEVWAFHDNLSASKGTVHTVREAKKRGIFVMEYSHPGSR